MNLCTRKFYIQAEADTHTSTHTHRVEEQQGAAQVSSFSSDDWRSSRMWTFIS